MKQPFHSPVMSKLPAITAYPPASRWSTFHSLFRFLLAGLPAFVLAVPMNFLLVDTFGFPKWLAYPIVLFVQVNIGFLLCRWKVFTPNETKPLWRQYTEFLGAVALFRVLDAILYAFLAEEFPFRLVLFGKNCYYLVYQLLNVALFSMAKFVFCRYAIEGTRP